MLIYFVRRLTLAVVTVLAISVISFAIIQLPPGDFVDAYIAQLLSMNTIVGEAEAQAMRAEYALDRPFWVQYYRWVSHMTKGDFGLSMEYRRPVRDVLGDRLALTAVLTFTSIVFTWILAIPIGIYSAVKQYSIGDYVFTFVGFLGLGLPNFLLALVVLYVGFVVFDANVGGLFSPEYAAQPYTLGKILDLLNHLWLPSIVLAIAGTAQLIRVLRANLLDELRKPYVVTARAKGLDEWRVIMKYPVRVALNPLISTIGYLLPLIVSGSIIVSVVMSLPTVGPLLLKALLAQDMFLAGTIILMIGIMTVIGTLISDLLLAWIDPRIKLETT